MRKVISMSTLVSGLLALPLLATAKPVAGDVSNDQAMVAEMQAHVDAVTGEAVGPLEAERMQDLYQRMLASVQSQMTRARARARTPLFFIEDVSPPGSSVFPGIALPAPMMEKAAFLGVATSPISGALRDQLKLQRGMGLIVDYVAVDSPAFQAGMQPHDVLEKLEDQWLVNAPQFAALVRAKKPGDSVVLTVIRGGERLKVTVVLAEKELPVLEETDAFRFSGGGPNLVAGTADVELAPGGGGGSHRGAVAARLAQDDLHRARWHCDPHAQGRRARDCAEHLGTGRNAAGDPGPGGP